ncbi:MAG: universal stress protein [Gemmatimonadota bacterium]
MLHSILVPLDGSRFAEYALPIATGLAGAAGARLRLLMVHEPMMALVPAVDFPIGIGVDDLGARVEAQTYLAETALELGSVGSRPVTYEMADGLAASTIEDAVTSTPPDLIVMSTHGRGMLSRFWLGSVADHLVRHVSVPILLLRPRDGADFPPPRLDLRRILVPLDLSGTSEAILGPVKALAQVTQAHLTLLHVVEPILGTGGRFSPVAIAQQLAARRTDAQEHLDSVADRLRAEGFRVAARVVVTSGIATTILGRLEDDRYDLVAMATHGAGGGRRLLLGSVTDKVIRGGTKPVLVYRPIALPPPRQASTSNESW